MSVVRLSKDDWNILLEGEEIVIGTTVLVIKPFSLKDLGLLAMKSRGIIKAIQKSKIDFNHILEGNNLSELFQMVMSNAPQFMEIATGLHKEDLEKLPVTKAVCLLEKVVKVNLDSQDGFNEALESLGKLLFPREKEEKDEEEMRETGE